MSGLASGGVGDPLRDGVPVAGASGVPGPGPSLEHFSEKVPPCEACMRRLRLLRSDVAAAAPASGCEALTLDVEAFLGQAQVPGPGPSIETSESEAKPYVASEGQAFVGMTLRELAGRPKWPPADEASAPEGAQPKRPALPSPAYVLGVELRQRQRELATWQERDFINREFQRQARLVRRLAPVLQLLAESAEGQAARVHCTDPTDDEWKARWEAADPWGFLLWQQARAVLAKVGQ